MRTNTLRLCVLLFGVAMTLMSTQTTATAAIPKASVRFSKSQIRMGITPQRASFGTTSLEAAITPKEAASSVAFFSTDKRYVTISEDGRYDNGNEVRVNLSVTAVRPSSACG